LAAPTRRRMLGILGGGALGSIVTALADAAARVRGDGTLTTQGDRNRRPRGFQCKTAGTKCIHNPPKGKKSTGKLCRKCCQTFRKVSKRVGVCCIPNGQPCESATDCCLGSCSVGLCQNEVIQLPPPCRGIGEVCTRREECCTGTLPRTTCGFVDPDKGRFGCGLASAAIRCCTTEGWECQSTCECCGSMACLNGTCGYSLPGEIGTCQVVQPKHDDSCLIPDNQPPPELCCLEEGGFCSSSCHCCGTLTCQDSACSSFGTG
jgi:hypothetical protein